MKYWRSSVLAAALLISAASALPDRLSAQVIAGRVTDDRTQQPVIDYVVRLVQMSDTGLVALDETTTDHKGQFTVVAPGAGSYVLSFGRTAPRVHRVPVEIAAGVAPAPKDFPLPIQRDADTRPYFDVDVDSAFNVMSRMSGAPRYPATTSNGQLAGSLFAMFVIDTAGRAERGSVRLFAGTHSDFTTSVDEWLRGNRFRVPTVGGVAVRRYVCFPIVFRPHDEGRRTSRTTTPTIPAAGISDAAKALCSRAITSAGPLTVFTR